MEMKKLAEQDDRVKYVSFSRNFGKEAAMYAGLSYADGDYVTVDNYVSMSDGTGIVHIAPAFGEDDGRVGRNYDLPFVQFVDGKGNMTAET